MPRPRVFSFGGQMKISIRRLLIAMLALLLSTASNAQLSVIETDSLRLLYFDPTETYLTPRVIQTFHNSLERQKSILGYVPQEKTTVLLTDFSDYGNAGASSVPGNSIVIDVAPIPLTFETAAPAERIYTIMNHELVHIATTDQTAPADDKARRFFRGKVLVTPEHPETILYQYLTAPRKTSPRWYLEGLAVFQETWMAGGLGRSQGGFDEMVFRAKVKDGTHIYDPLGLVAEGVRVDFQVGVNAYLYGGRFISYVAYHWSPQQLVEWAQRLEGSRRSYEEEFERVFGLTLNEAWQDWIEWETEFQQKNLASVQQFPVTPHEDLTEGGLGSVSRAWFDAERNSLFAGFRYPGVVAHIGELSLANGEIERLHDIKGPMVYRVSSVAYDADSSTVFHTADNYGYRDLMATDIATGKTRLLQKDVRIGDIVVNPVDKSIWGVRHLNGYASIVRVPHPYTEWNLVQTLPYGGVASDLDISADGRLLSGSFGDINGKQSLKVFETKDLLAGEFEAINVLNMGQAVPEGFVFSPDGQYLFGSSYYTGVSNIFRYELATDEFEAVSNADIGFFRPIPVDNENLIVFRYAGDGFVPARIKAEPLEDVSAITFLGAETIRKHPVLKTWRAGSPDDIAAAERIESTGHYVPIENIRTESLHPVILGYKDSVSLGMRANFSDPIRLDTLGITASYSTDSDLPSNERPNLNIQYKHNIVSASPLAGTWNFGASLNYADFYDLFGPTKKSRKGNRFGIEFDKTLISDSPKRLDFSAGLFHFSNMDALPRYQDVPVTFDKLSSLEVGLHFENHRASLGAVDAEKGYDWTLGGSVDYVDGETIPKYFGSFDFGFALPWKHASIWLRNSAGSASGDATDEFANFFFGGFGNNYVDRGDVKRYRSYYSMPGFEINDLFGRNFHRAMLEFNLPPVHFQRAGTSDFYLSWVRTALFASNLTTNFDDSALRQEAQSAGIQFDLRFTVMSRLNMTLSLGYARGFGEDSFEDDEFMVSLKVL